MISDVVENGLESLILVRTADEGVALGIEDFFVFLFCQIVKDLDKSQKSIDRIRIEALPFSIQCLL